MFWGKKKQVKRKVFGFPCSPSISLGIKVAAERLGTPIYPFAEHAFQLGLSLILVDLEDEGFRERLAEHVIENHLLVNNVDPDNEYDESAMAEARKKQLEHQERERAIRLLVNEVENNGIPPRLIAIAVKLLVETALNRKRTQ